MSRLLGVVGLALLAAATAGGSLVSAALEPAQGVPVPVVVSSNGPGPISTLYWTRWDRNLLATFQGLTVSGVDSVVPRPATIAVLDDGIHTVGLGGATGARYALDGTYLGDLPANGLNLNDGTTDGTFNYAFRNTGGQNALYRFDLNWQNPSVYIPYAALGNGGIFGLAGLTYDPTDDTFWAIDYGGPGAIHHLARNGTDLGQFVVGAWSLFLAMDHADHTLWTYSGSGRTDEMQQYSTSGVLLQTVVFTEHLGITSAEFGPPSAPDSDGDGVPDDQDAFPNDPAESTDSDGDGVGDNHDAVPHSNTDALVVVGTCTVQTVNQRLPGGATFNDLLAAAAAGARNHGAAVSAITHLVSGWKKTGLVSGSVHGAIVSCVR